MVGQAQNLVAVALVVGVDAGGGKQADMADSMGKLSGTVELEMGHQGIEG